MHSCGRIGARLLSGAIRHTVRSAAQPLLRVNGNRFQVPTVRCFATPPGSEQPTEEKPKEETKEAEEPKAEETEEPAGNDEVSPDSWTQEELLAEYKKLKEAHDGAAEEINKLKNQLAYSLADIENVRKIAKKDMDNARDFALKGFAKDLLEVVDNCDRALSIFPEEAKVKGHEMAGIYVGLEMTQNVMIKGLEKHGLVKMETIPNETVFDPNLHDALFQQPVEGLEAGIIFSIVKSGWTINGRVLRAAQVGVSADPEE